jgi:fructoselysine 6-kinase
MALGAPRVASIGDNCIDRYEEPVALSAVGGNALNVAVRWRRAGFRAEYLGAVGPDEAGARIRGALEREEVAIDRLRTLPGRTGDTRIRLTAQGERVFVAEDYGVSADYAPTAADLEHLRTLDHVHVANLFEPEPVIRALRDGRARVSHDLGERRPLPAMPGLDLVLLSMPKASSDEAAARAAHDAVAAGAATALVTNGAGGSVACEGGRVVSMPAVPVEVVDTCGAGDAYLAEFVAERLRGGPLERCMEAGAGAAARCCASLGAWSQELEPVAEAVR